MFRFIKILLLSSVSLVACLALAITAYVNLAPIFGGDAEGSGNAKIAASPHYDRGRFANLLPTEVMTEGDVDPDRSTVDFFFPPDGKRPTGPIPSRVFSGRALTNGNAVWLGHSTFLFRTAGRAVLVDPVFFEASPIPFSVKAYDLQHTVVIDDLPPLDAVLISHDHYDHLDYRAIVALDRKVGQFLVPLGVGAHLARWGIDARKVIEFDWYEHHDMGETRFTFTPSRHFSGRGLTNRNTTLWGGWAVRSPDHNLYYSGDSGYFDEFAEIGRRLGPFDMAFMENGAYDPTWAEIHMTPENSVRASVELGAAAFFPVHWGRFDLAYHPWDEPIRRAARAAESEGVKIATPLIGEVFALDDPPQRSWWEDMP